MYRDWETEKTRQDRLRQWLNLQQEERKKALSKQSGVNIGKSTGSSSFTSGSVAPDDAPAGEGDNATQEDKEKLITPNIS